MPGLLASNTVPVLHHVLIDILIPYRGLGIADSNLVQGLVQSKIAHHRCNHRVIFQLFPLFHITTIEIHDFIAVYQRSGLIHRQAAVRVAIIGETYIHAVLHHKFL